MHVACEIWVTGSESACAETADWCILARDASGALHHVHRCDAHAAVPAPGETLLDTFHRAFHAAVNAGVRGARAMGEARSAYLARRAGA